MSLNFKLATFVLVFLLPSLNNDWFHVFFSAEQRTSYLFSFGFIWRVLVFFINFLRNGNRVLDGIDV